MGNFDLIKKPNLIFDDLVIEFLNSISREILNDKYLKIFPDLYVPLDKNSSFHQSSPFV